jgi:hypothetical protein
MIRRGSRLLLCANGRQHPDPVGGVEPDRAVASRTCRNFSVVYVMSPSINPPPVPAMADDAARPVNSLSARNQSLADPSAGL